LASLALAFHSRKARAAGFVPANLQAQLIVRVAAFDRNFAARAGATALVFIVQKPGDADSVRLASAVNKSMDEEGDIAGKPKNVEVVTFGDAAGIGSLCKKRKPAIVYFSTGFENDLPGIANALDGVDVLTFGATATHAEKGTVVGFDLDEGKPKLVVNLARAKAQNVSFKPGLLKLARIVA